jgi:nucleoside-diphosphate-sugar epimerase
MEHLAPVCGARGRRGRRVEGVVLRYGFYYGPGTWYDRDGAVTTMIRKRRHPLIGNADGRSSFVDVDDATGDEPLAQRTWRPEVVG